MNHQNVLAGTRPAGACAAVLASVLLFGTAHGYQGITGVVENVLVGVLFGVLYLAGRRNLWLPILTHGAIDTIGFLLIFTGLYP